MRLSHVISSLRKKYSILWNKLEFHTPASTRIQVSLFRKMCQIRSEWHFRELHFVHWTSRITRGCLWRLLASRRNRFLSSRLEQTQSQNLLHMVHRETSSIAREKPFIMWISWSCRVIENSSRWSLKPSRSARYSWNWRRKNLSVWNNKRLRNSRRSTVLRTRSRCLIVANPRSSQTTAFSQSKQRQNSRNR